MLTGRVGWRSPLASGLVVLASRRALRGRPAAAFEPRDRPRARRDPGGRVWLVASASSRCSRLLLLRLSVKRRADWRAGRGKRSARRRALGPLAAAATPRVEPARRARSRSTDCTVGAGVWVGGLLPLALLLRAAATEEGARGPYAVLAARRFSRTASANPSCSPSPACSSRSSHVGSVAGFRGHRAMAASLSTKSWAFSSWPWPSRR